jgi:SAM-dependent methyltransferase
MPSQSDVEAIYASESYNKSYDQVGQDFVVSEATAEQQLEPRFAKLASYLPSKGRMLDIGASRGVFLEQARLHGWSIFGLEAGDESINYAMHRYGIQIERGTLESTLLPTSYYDCVHLSHVLEHLHDPTASLRKISACMKQGGVIVIEVPYEFGDLFDRIREIFLRRPRPVNVVPSSHLYFFSLRSLRSLLDSTGFEILFSATPRRNQSFESRLPMGAGFKRAVYQLEQVLNMGPLIEVFARKR